MVQQQGGTQKVPFLNHPDYLNIELLASLARFIYAIPVIWVDHSLGQGDRGPQTLAL